MNMETVSKLSIVELFGLAEFHKAQGDDAAIPVLYKTWIVCHADHPALFAAYFNYGTVLSEQGDQPGAIIALRESLRLKPDFHQARLSLGLVLEKVGQNGDAIQGWMAVSNDLAGINGETLTQKIIALENTGRLLESLDQDEAAEEALLARLDLGFDDKVAKHWIALRMRQCKWPVLTPVGRIKREELVASVAPLTLATLSDDPLFQLAKAVHYNRTALDRPRPGAVLPPPPVAARRPGEKIRIGYVSSDLREHAVGFSIVETLELHDRDRFEITAYYCGIPREDPTKARIRSAVDRWVDINGLGDEEAAQQIRADAIDILVDLNGYTKDARTAVFGLRPAPIAVSWFGFPSTMGSPYHHYLIADAHTVPPGSERFYSETVVRLPCYQPNDRKRVVAAKPPTRADEGLPDNAVVFCSLNGLQKLTAPTFERWLGILDRVPDGVLWLLAGTAETQARLRQRAAERGVAPERLVFAAKQANPSHVARYALADLFLDHGPYGAHTTAADALWMGVPVLTCPGRSFASRVCSSLVSAAGLPELICATPEAYVARAVQLGTDRRLLASLRRRLEEGRDACLLFDTPRLVAGLEDLYAQMIVDRDRGLVPVPDLTNLDVYHEIGMASDFEHAEELSDSAYEAIYAQGLEEWSRITPVRRDARLRSAPPVPPPQALRDADLEARPRSRKAG